MFLSGGSRGAIMPLLIWLLTIQFLSIVGPRFLAAYQLMAVPTFLGFGLLAPFSEPPPFIFSLSPAGKGSPLLVIYGIKFGPL